MMVGIKGFDMPEECGKCFFFGFNGISCTGGGAYLNTKCYLIKAEYIGHESDYGVYYEEERHTINKGERWAGCPLVEVGK